MMKFLTIRFPELDHLPTEQREAILRRCIEMREMRSVRVAPRYLAGVLAISATALFLLLLFVWRWSFLLAWLVYVLVVFCSAIIMLALGYTLKARMLHKLVRAELKKGAFSKLCGSDGLG
jgi:ABC-type bacteriocin/lantibiotic exporter with double-glycine peptidase domain